MSNEKKTIRIEKTEIRFFGLVLVRHNLITEVDEQKVFVSDTHRIPEKGSYFIPASIGFSVDVFLQRIESLNSM